MTEMGHLSLNVLRSRKSSYAPGLIILEDSINHVPLVLLRSLLILFDVVKVILFGFDGVMFSGFSW